MIKLTMVRIHECANGRRRLVGDVAIDVLMDHLAKRLSVLQVEQLGNDLIVLGNARSNETRGRWSEYEIVPALP